MSSHSGGGLRCKVQCKDFRNHPYETATKPFVETGEVNDYVPE